MKEFFSSFSLNRETLYALKIKTTFFKRKLFVLFAQNVCIVSISRFFPTDFTNDSNEIAVENRNF